MFDELESYYVLKNYSNTVTQPIYINDLSNYVTLSCFFNENLLFEPLKFCSRQLKFLMYKYSYPNFNQIDTITLTKASLSYTANLTNSSGYQFLNKSVSAAPAAARNY